VPARNIHHDAVVQALVADDWTITDDPLKITFGEHNLYVDLGVERGTLTAERSGQHIAVEVQSFLSPSPIRDLQEAVGQYVVYRVVLAEMEPERLLYLAVTRGVYDNVFADRFGQLIVASVGLRILVFDEKQQRVIQWIS
jgi:hypothetical protein